MQVKTVLFILFIGFTPLFANAPIQSQDTQTIFQTPEAIQPKLSFETDEKKLELIEKAKKNKDWNFFLVVSLDASDENDFKSALDYNDQAFFIVNQMLNGDENEQRMQETTIAYTLLSRGLILEQMEEYKEAIKAYNELLERFRHPQTIFLQEMVAQSLLNKGVALGKLNKPQEELKIYNEFLQKFQNSRNENIQVMVAQCLLNKGIAFQNMNMLQEELKVYNQLLAKFKTTENASIQEQVAMALINKGITLTEQKMFKQAIQTYNTFFMMFKNTQDEAVKEQVSMVWNNVFELYIIQNKPFDTKQIPFETYKHDRQFVLEFTMLEIIQDSLYEDQTLAINALYQEFSDLNFNNWSFQELDDWALTLKGDQKKRINTALERFKHWDQSNHLIK